MSVFVLGGAFVACSSFSSTGDPVAPTADAASEASTPDAAIVDGNAPAADATADLFPGCPLLVDDAFPANTHDPGWTLAGEAAFGQGALVLTEDVPYKRGGVWISTSRALPDATALHVRFDLQFEHPDVDGGLPRGDGLSFFWLHDKTFELGGADFGECGSGTTTTDGYAFVVASHDLSMSLHDPAACGPGIADTPLSFPVGQSQPVAIDITRAKIVAKVADHQFSSALTNGVKVNTVGFTGITGGYSCRHTVTNVKIWVCP